LQFKVIFKKYAPVSCAINLLYFVFQQCVKKINYMKKHKIIVLFSLFFLFSSKNIGSSVATFLTESNNITASEILTDTTGITDCNRLNCYYTNQIRRQKIELENQNIKQTKLFILFALTFILFFIIVIYMYLQKNKAFINLQKQQLAIDQTNQKLQQHNAEMEITQSLLSEKQNIIEQQNLELQKNILLLNKYLLVIEQSPSAIIITDIDGNIEYVNPQFTKQSGYSQEEVFGKNPRILQSGKTELLLFKQMWETLVAGKEWRGEFINMQKNGTEFIEKSVIAPIFNEKKEIINYLAIKEDITEIKHVQQILESNKKQLFKLNKSLLDERNIFMKGNVIVLKWKNAQNLPIEYVSKNVTNVLVYSPKELQKGYLDLIHKDDRERFEYEISEALRNDVIDFEFPEYRIINKNGKEVWLYNYTTLQKNEANQTTHFYGYAIDVTDKKNAEIAMNEALKQAENANKLKSEFLANISHEIRTPMNAIIGFSSILKKRIADTQSLYYADKIESNSRKLLLLISDIIELSKIETGQFELKMEAFNLESLLTELPLIFAEKLKNKSVLFQIDIDKDLPKYLLIDAERLRQIFMKLIGNAFKFTTEGSVKIAVKIENIQNVNPQTAINLKLEIEDTGIGIDEKDLPHLFHTFRQLNGESTRKYGGSGLGLAITKRQVELMNGSIQIESKLGVGSKFTVVFNEVSVLSNKSKAEFNENLNQIKKKIKILNVEDIQYNRELISMFLDSQNIEILEAQSAEEAFELLKTEIPDIILMDIQLPGINGYELAKILRASEKWKNIPIIAVTANTNYIETVTYKYIFNEYIPKPIDDNLLINAILKHINPFAKSDENNENIEKINCINELKRYKIEHKEFSNQLKDTLHFDLLPRFKELQEILSVDKLKLFAFKMNEISVIHKINIFSKYAETLNESITNFDLNKINELLNSFVEIKKIITEQ